MARIAGIDREDRMRADRQARDRGAAGVAADHDTADNGVRVGRVFEVDRRAIGYAAGVDRVADGIAHDGRIGPLSVSEVVVTVTTVATCTALPLLTLSTVTVAFRDVPPVTVLRPVRLTVKLDDHFTNP